MAPPIADRLLRVDLSAGSVESTPIPDEWRRRYVGGKGLGARYLYDELDAGVDPLGEENAILFMLGPLSGYLPGDSRYAAITKSPLTGCFLDSYAGGEFPDSLAGALGSHMGLLVTGVASEPVHLVIEDGDATIEPAETWGAGTVETARAFPTASVACIGPAGERQVAYATIASDAGDHHAGRGGAGAVMGSKRLKAIVARGDPPDGLDDLREAYAAKYRETATGRWLQASGTVETIDFANEIGALSTRGWSDGQFEAADELGIATVEDRAVGREHADTETPGGYRVATEEGDHVPRGATAMTLGAGLDIDDFDAVAVLGQTCDRLGMDLISAGSAVAWTVKANDTDVLDRSLSFGEPDGARALLAGNCGTRIGPRRRARGGGRSGGNAVRRPSPHPHGEVDGATGLRPARRAEHGTRVRDQRPGGVPSTGATHRTRGVRRRLGSRPDRGGGHPRTEPAVGALEPHRG